MCVLTSGGLVVAERCMLGSSLSSSVDRRDLAEGHEDAILAHALGVASNLLGRVLSVLPS